MEKYTMFMDWKNQYSENALPYPTPLVPASVKPSDNLTSYLTGPHGGQCSLTWENWVKENADGLAMRGPRGETRRGPGQGPGERHVRGEAAPGTPDPPQATL